MLSLGIDEAGRGCFIGPMVVAGVVLDEVQAKKLKELGVDDSKKLSRKKRTELFFQILDNSKWFDIAIVSPSVIDKYNLNLLTLNMMKLISKRAIERFPSLEIIIADMVGHKQKKLITESNVIQIMEAKADSKYVEVSSASIVAKTFRDYYFSLIKKKYGAVGSGYPSDKRSVIWINQNFDRLSQGIVRSKWKLIKNIKAKKLEDYLAK